MDPKNKEMEDVTRIIKGRRFVEGIGEHIVIWDYCCWPEIIWPKTKEVYENCKLENGGKIC